ncbi:Arginyl-tRNA--protein transferase 1 [Rhizina undulata]
MSNAHDPVTLIAYVGLSSGSSCGYCKSPFGANSFYVRAHSLTVQHYQLLLDRGWRRSGNLLYKPHMKSTCCPHYTIRLDTEEFHPPRDLRQSLHKWSRHILGDDYIHEAAIKYPKSKKEKKNHKNKFNLSESVHAPEYSAIQNQVPPEPAHKLEVDLEPADFTEEKYALFEHYQRTVHHESPGSITRQGFKRFLCTSPLQNTTTSSGKRLGSYHQCYRVDGRLVAMAVLDLLPRAVSGVYFMYHEDYAPWSMGKLSGCIEATLAKEEGYRYYYMGYYIHSCQKMQYKEKFRPSDLLDPENYTWNRLDAGLLEKLDQHRYYAPSTGEAFGPGPRNPSNTSEEGSLGFDYEMEPDDVFAAEMPGLVPDDDLENFDIGNIKLKFGSVGNGFEEVQLKELDYLDGLNLRFKELVATMGLEVANEMVVSAGSIGLGHSLSTWK